MLRLVVGNLNYSSWSMRPWLALTHARAEFRVHDIGLKTAPDWKERILAFSGAGKVPVLVDGNLSIHESLAICEYAAELFPEARLWPTDAKLRARGRAISAEMSSGFSLLRSRMPTNLRARAERTPSGDGLEQEIARVLDIWQASLSASEGPFLLGEFSIADCMYFPVLGRFRTYGVTLEEPLAAYASRIFALPAVMDLEDIARASAAIPEYDAAFSAAR